MQTRGQILEKSFLSIETLRTFMSSVLWNLCHLGQWQCSPLLTKGPAFPEVLKMSGLPIARDLLQWHLLEKVLDGVQCAHGGLGVKIRSCQQVAIKATWYSEP